VLKICCIVRHICSHPARSSSVASSLSPWRNSAFKCSARMPECPGALPFASCCIAVAISFSVGTSSLIVNGVICGVIGSPGGIAARYNDLYSFVVVRKSDWVGRGGGSPACLYHRCKTFHTPFILPACSFCSISLPVFVVRCFRSRCIALFIRRDNRFRSPGRKDCRLLLDALASINFQVVSDIHGVFVALLISGA
jgi:hypothetical protein